jgi:catechol 2,3-dioxygenase-like lactoylglutathione lyase family enzyme
MTGIDHVGLTVSSLERSLRFYGDLLGLRELGRSDDGGPWLDAIIDRDRAAARTADLDAGEGRVLELIEYRNPRDPPASGGSARPGTLHVAILVESVENVLARLAGAGAVPVSRCPVVLDLPGTRWHGATVAYVQDPDGALVELVETARV